MKKGKHSVPPASSPPRPPAISVPRHPHLPAPYTYEHWTAEEERLLGTRPDRELAQPYPLNPWTPREKALLGTMWDRKLAARIGRSEISVRMQRLKLGIPAFGQWHSLPHAEPAPRERRKTRRS